MIKFATKFIDFFYLQPFRRLIPLNTFRYAFVGGFNLLVNMVVYYLCYNLLLGQKDTDFGLFVISGHVLALFIQFAITVFPNYWLVRNLAFSGSYLKGRTQLMRYAGISITNILINYAGLKILVNVCGFYASPSYAVVQIFTVTFSYLMQRFYSFRGHTKL